MPLDFTQDYILENDVVLLRPLNGYDIKHLLSFSLNEPELWRYSLTSADGEENLKSYVKLALESRSAETGYPFIVYDKTQNKYAGSTRFYDYQKTHNTTQLGYTWYGQEFQRTGLNRNCKFLLLEWAFESLELDRVEFRADFMNKRSIVAIKSLGCTEEGILRSNCSGIQGRRDSIVLSILRNEWFDHCKQLIQDKIR